LSSIVAVVPTPIVVTVAANTAARAWSLEKSEITNACPCMLAAILMCGTRYGDCVWDASAYRVISAGLTNLNTVRLHRLVTEWRLSDASRDIQDE